MGDKAGARGSLSVVLTRESRWFFDETIPPWFLQWFESLPGPLFHEDRSDVYDLEAAHQNVGLKRRSPANTLDCKMKLASQQAVDLGFGIEGDVEDWIKISQPLDESSLAPGRAEVFKRTKSKRFFLDTKTGCEAEVAEISVGEVVAWTLCLETFGDGDLRGAAMAHGVEAVFGVVGYPSQLLLTAANSYGYPEWLALNYARRSLTRDHPSPLRTVESLRASDQESQAS